MASMTNAFWKPAGAIYLLVSILALALGLWPETVLPPRTSVNPAPLPALSALAVGQMAYLVLVWPLVIARRTRRQGPQCPGCLAVELLGLLAVAVPMYVVAAWFSDGRAEDAARVALLVLAAGPLSWLLGRLLAGPRAMPWVLLAMILLGLGLPALYYVLVDFAAPLGADWAWELSPVSLAWSVGRAPQADWLPSPLWAPLLWLIAGAGGLTMLHLAERGGQPSTDDQ
jgi:hypothetical protein